jgi:hypothetical protein
MMQMGLYLGFLLFEAGRRDWKNVTLILTVGLLNGVGWSLLQTWQWASTLWPEAQFNFWRSWETSGGISIGIAYGVAFYLVNRPRRESERAVQEPTGPAQPPSLGWLVAFLITTANLGYISPEVMPVWCSMALTLITAAFGIAYYVFARKSAQGSDSVRAAWSPYGPNLERWGAFSGILLGLGLSIKNGFKGSAGIYLGNESYWDDVFMNLAGPLMILAFIALCVWILLRPRPGGHETDPFPRAYGTIWLVVLVQNFLGQISTGPPTNWNEVVFNIYYVLLFFITAVILYHYHFVKRLRISPR